MGLGIVVRVRVRVRTDERKSHRNYSWREGWKRGRALERGHFLPKTLKAKKGERRHEEKTTKPGVVRGGGRG